MHKDQIKQSIISAKKARINFGEVLDEAFYGGKEFLVTKKDKPMVVIMGVGQRQKLRTQNDAQSKIKTSVKFPTHNLGKMKLPLTRENMYDERTSRIA